MNTETPADKPQNEPLAPLPEGMITEAEAADLLGISVMTLRNMVYNKRIPETHYATAVTGKRFYFRDKLLGL
jgi:excisionase family DNA binding protein